MRKIIGDRAAKWIVFIKSGCPRGLIVTTTERTGAYFGRHSDTYGVFLSKVKDSPAGKNRP
jgi:hypothetical protein